MEGTQLFLTKQAVANQSLPFNVDLLAIMVRFAASTRHPTAYPLPTNFKTPTHHQYNAISIN
jgi:hypothetical protein